jgi:hypothetical protein
VRVCSWTKRSSWVKMFNFASWQLIVNLVGQDGRIMEFELCDGIQFSQMDCEYYLTIKLSTTVYIIDGPICF